MVGDVLHLAAVAERAELGGLAREVGEDRAAFFDRARVAARKHDEIARLRLRAGPA